MSGAPELQRLADGVWAYIQPDGGWMINNMGLIAGNRGATSIDVTSTEQRTRRYLTAAERVAGPIRRVILTHSHPDHCNGASLLPDAEIVAHHTVAREIQDSPPPGGHIFTPFDQGGVHPRMPTVEFEDRMTFESGERSFEVRHPGFRAHTRGDAYVWLAQERVLFAGDLVFNGGTPFVLSGSPSGWLRALEQMAALDPVTVVPGHGAVGGPELLGQVSDYLRFLMAAAEEAHAKGQTPLEAARHLDLGGFGNLMERERIAGNLHRAYAEIDGGEPDFRQAWQDMYDYNGSRPLSCHA